jgi:CrcB protein
MWQSLVWMMAAGSAGTVARALLGAGVQRMFGPEFPYGTAVVNVVGCFAFGVSWALLEQRASLGPVVRLAVLTGFLGAFTTFSTYMFELHQLLVAHRHAAAALHFFGQNALGLAALAAGIALASSR